jgi:hypothetical protein
MALDEIIDLNDLKSCRLGQEAAWPPFAADALRLLAEFRHADAGDRRQGHASLLNLLADHDTASVKHARARSGAQVMHVKIVASLPLVHSLAASISEIALSRSVLRRL